MGTVQKQKQIRTFLESLGWSINQLSDVLYEELYCDEHDDVYDTPNNFQEMVKKQLQRPTTPESRLDEYIKIISQHPDFIALNLDIIVPKHVEHPCMSDDMFTELKNISNWLDEDESAK